MLNPEFVIRFTRKPVNHVIYTNNFAIQIFLSNYTIELYIGIVV